MSARPVLCLRCRATRHDTALPAWGVPKVAAPPCQSRSSVVLGQTQARMPCAAGAFRDSVTVVPTLFNGFIFTKPAAYTLTVQHQAERRIRTQDRARSDRFQRMLAGKDRQINQLAKTIPELPTGLCAAHPQLANSRCEMPRPAGFSAKGSAFHGR
ncbi:hypothetical protein DWB67_01340 [Paracoccus sp. JM45]|nr:hypothetical protein DWB67_01340 [Paracoccus sp. JM45]